MNSRSTISAIGRACVQRSSIIPPAVCERHETEVEIMKRLGLVYENNAQCMALSSLATVSMTRLAKPCPAKQDPPTTYEARSKLTAEGWEPVMAAYKCSVSDKRMMKHQCSSYYWLLIQNRDEILQMTEENFFPTHRNLDIMMLLLLHVRSNHLTFGWFSLGWLISFFFFLGWKSDVFDGFFFSEYSKPIWITKHTGVWDSVGIFGWVCRGSNVRANKPEGWVLRTASWSFDRRILIYHVKWIPSSTLILNLCR